MDRQARTTEVMKIFTKLRDMGLGITEYDEMIRFRHLCNAFIRCAEKYPSPERNALFGTILIRIAWIAC